MPCRAEFMGLSAAPRAEATPGRAGHPKESDQMWVLLWITPGLCSMPTQCWCEVKTSASSTPSPCPPAGNALPCPCSPAMYCCELRHRTDCSSLSCNFPVQSGKMRC